MSDNWIECLVPEKSVVKYRDVIYTYMGIDNMGNYILYGLPYHLSKYQMANWCLLYE